MNNDWWIKKKEKTRRYKKRRADYTLFDGVADLFFGLPELLLFPIRIIYWVVRGVGRIIGEVFNF